MNYSLQTLEVHPTRGLDETLKQMFYLERLTFGEKNFIEWVWNKFDRGCADCLPGVIYRYMRDNFKYAIDAPYDELIIAPYVMRELKEGDCDDFSLFGKTCIDILGGWFSNYILFGQQKNAYTHVAVFVHRGKVGRKYIDGKIIDGANPNFNVVNPIYKYYKIIEE